MRRGSGQAIVGKMFPRNMNHKQIAKVASALMEGSSKKPSHVKGVKNGRFFRVKLQRDAPKSNNSISHLMQLPAPGGPTPHAFKTIQSKASSSRKSSQGGSSSFQDYWVMMQEWLKENWPTVVLNMGSVATLIGFTRYVALMA